MEKIYCIKCNGVAVKNGFQKQIQRYKCKLCQKKFQLGFAYKAYNIGINNSITILLKEGCGVRSIARILNISKNTVLARIISIGKKLKAKPLLQKGCSYEIDEIWTFIGNKSNVTWITYAIERKSKNIVGFILGSKTKENIQPLVHKLILSVPKHIYTDGLNIYPALIPKGVHKRFQYCTNYYRTEQFDFTNPFETIKPKNNLFFEKCCCFSRCFKDLLLG